MGDKKYYEEIAKQHTGIQAVMHSSKPLAWYRHFLETKVLRRYLDDGNGNRDILDIGCGNGRFFPLFWKKGYQIYGVDFSKELINQACITYCGDPWATSIEQYPLAIFPPPHLKVSNSAKLPYKKQEFDYVFLILLLPHDDEKIFKQTILEAKRVLKKGGKMFIIDEPDTTGSVWNADTIKLVLGDNFQLIEDRFIRSDAASRLLSKNSYKDIKSVNASKENKIQGNIFKDLIKIFINIWIDIPSIIFRRKGSGFERLLIYENKKDNTIRINLPPH